MKNNESSSNKSSAILKQQINSKIPKVAMHQILALN
jgi:hypothetical protein